MRQIILFIITAVLVVYEANCTCRNIAPGVEVHMTQMEDFARRRLDAFRTIYAPTSVPYATSPQRTISLVAYLKLLSIATTSSIDNCPVEEKYQWAGTLSSSACCGYNQSLCAQEQITSTYVGASLTPPTDLTNYRYLISQPFSDEFLTSNVEQFVDSMLSESETNNIVFGNPSNDKWGVSIDKSNVNNLYYLVFAIADDTGDNTEPSLLCLPYEGTELSSSVAPPTSTQAPVTTTLPPTTTTSTITTTSTTLTTTLTTTSSTTQSTTQSTTTSTTPTTTQSTTTSTTPTTTQSTTTSTTPTTTQSTTTSTTPTTTQSTTTSTTPTTTPSTTTTTPSTSMTTYMTTSMTTSNFLTTVESTTPSTTTSAGVAAVSASIALTAALIALQ